MDDVEHGEDFSSQSAKSVTTYKRGANGRVRIELSDGSSFFVSESFFQSWRFEPGDPISAEKLDEIFAESEYVTAWDKSLELLGRRDHSEFELSRKLRSRKISVEVIRRIIDKLTENGYLDDRAFAEKWVLSRLRRHPEGRTRLAAGLARKGVGRSIVAEVLSDTFTDEEATVALERAAQKLIRTGKDDPALLLKKLTARGFSYRQVQAYLQNLK